MKKISVLFFLLFSGPFIIWAQTNGIGLSIGAVQSNIFFQGKNVVKGKEVIDPVFGIFGYGKINDNWGLNVSLEIAGVGTEIHDSLFFYSSPGYKTVDEKIIIDIYRIEILPYFLIKDHIFLTGAPVLDVISKKTFTGSQEILDGGHTQAGSFIDKSTEGKVKLGLCLGGGMMFGNFKLEIKYVNSLGNLFSELVASSYPNYEYAKFNSLQVSIGYIIPSFQYSINSSYNSSLDTSKNKPVRKNK